MHIFSLLIRAGVSRITEITKDFYSTKTCLDLSCLFQHGSFFDAKREQEWSLLKIDSHFLLSFQINNRFQYTFISWKYLVYLKKLLYKIKVFSKVCGNDILKNWMRSKILFIYLIFVYSCLLYIVNVWNMEKIFFFYFLFCISEFSQ